MLGPQPKRKERNEMTARTARTATWRDAERKRERGALWKRERERKGGRKGTG